MLQQLIGNNFEVKTSSYVEDNNLGLEPIKLVLHHSLEKGRDVAKHFKTGTVISADTFILFEDKIIGKPRTEENARKTLKKISGNFVEILSGIAVIDIESGKEIQDYEITRVKIKKMSDEEIERYVKSGEPLDKAGAFGIQRKGAILVERIEGCYFNVVGLPLFKLNKILERLGISIFEYDG